MNTLKNLSLLFITIVSSILPFYSSQAADPQTSNLTVQANIVATCTVLPATLDFMTYSSGAVNDTQTNISVSCALNTPYTVTLDKGQNESGSARNMKLTTPNPGTDTLEYELYSDTVRNTVWNTTNTVTGTGNGLTQLLPVFGRITAGQNKSPGGYSDTVVITVTY